VPIPDIVDDRRSEPPLVADERTMLDAWLEYHRATLLIKCDGLDAASLGGRPLATSKLSLHGLVRHLAEVERHWFIRVLTRQPATADVHPGDGDEPDLDEIDAGRWADDLAAWEAECQRSRLAAADYQLDDTGHWRGKEVSLRWIYMHTIEEYARHNGHADLLREMADGAVGG
jgi:uncharacterized damage-inducible protein DinB